jgi:flagellar biogenesis protein FliO
LIIFPGEASSQTHPSSEGNVSGAGRYLAEVLSRMGEKTASLLSCAWKSARGRILRSWKRLRAQQIARTSSKRLQVAATVSLGEKRFVAVIQVDGREFLVGGGATNVALLAQLGAKKSFNGVLTKTMNASEETAPRKQTAKRMKKKMAAAVEQVGEQA